MRKYLGEDVDELMVNIANYFLDLSLPKVFNPYSPECILTDNDKKFEELCNSISENGLDIQNATVFSFYSKVEYLEKKNQRLKANAHK